MKYLQLLIFIFLFHSSFSQYKIDTTIKTEYGKMFERLSKVLEGADTQFIKRGIGVLTKLEADTLNKSDLEPIDTSVSIIVTVVGDHN